MSEAYVQHIENHRSNVLKAYNWFEENLPHLVSKYKFSRDQPLTFQATSFKGLIEKHDKSKYSIEEYEACDIFYYYPEAWSSHVINNYNKARLLHVHKNPHHWQYWVFVDYDLEEICIEMPYEYVIEMICDWWSEDLDDKPFDCSLENLFLKYNYLKDHKKLHPKTSELVLDILNQMLGKFQELKKELEELKK